MPYSLPTGFATVTVCDSLSKTINTKIRNKIIIYSQMYILTKSNNDNKTDNDEHNELVKLYEDYKKNKKSKLGIFLN